MVTLVASADEVIQPDNMGLKLLPETHQQNLVNYGKFFPFLDFHIKTAQNEKCDLNLSNTKICFEPNNQRFSYKDKKTNRNHHVFPLYLYNELAGGRDKEIPIKLPPSIVRNFMELLKEKEVNERQHRRHMMEADFDQDIKTNNISEYNNICKCCRLKSQDRQLNM